MMNECSDFLLIKGPNEQLRILDEIGSGAFGVVFKVASEKYTEAAVKVIPVYEKIEQPEKRNASRELRFHQLHRTASYHGPFIIKCYDSWEVDITAKEYLTWRKEVCQTLSMKLSDFPSQKLRFNCEKQQSILVLMILMEYCEAGNLETWLGKTRQDFETTFPLRVRVYRNIVEGVQFLHAKNLIHRDLSPANVLLTRVNGQLVPKISDFGTIVSLGQNVDWKLTRTKECRTGGLGTPIYAAPEALGSQYDKGVDLYSLGVLAIKMFSNPTYDLTNILISIQNKEDTANLESVFPSTAWFHFVGLQVSPMRKERLSCENILALEILDASNVNNSTQQFHHDGGDIKMDVKDLVQNSIKDETCRPNNAKKSSWHQFIDHHFQELIERLFNSLHESNLDLFYSCDTAKLQTYCMFLPSVNTVVKVEMIDELPQQDKYVKIVVIRQWTETSWESSKKLQEDQFINTIKTGKACVAIALDLEITTGIMRCAYHYLQNTCYIRLADNEQIILLERKKFFLINDPIKFLHYRLPKDPPGPISNLEFYAETTELNENDCSADYSQTFQTNWFEYHGSVSSFCSLLWNKELKVTETLHLEFWSVTPLIREEQTTVFSLRRTPTYNSKPISEPMYFQLDTCVVSMTVIDISHEHRFILYMESDGLLPTSKLTDIKKCIASVPRSPTLIAYKGSPVLLHDLTTKELISDKVPIILQLSNSDVRGPLELMPSLKLENGFCYGFKKLYDDNGVFAYFIRQLDANDSIMNNTADAPMEKRIQDKLQAKYVYFTGQLEGFSKLAALDSLPQAEQHYITSLSIKNHTSSDIEHRRICLKHDIDTTKAHKIVKFTDIHSSKPSKTFITVCCETPDGDSSRMEFQELDSHLLQTDHLVYVGKEQNFSDLSHRGIISPQNFFFSMKSNELGAYEISNHFVVTAQMQSVNETNVSFIIKLWYKVQSEDIREINIKMKGIDVTPGKMDKKHFTKFMNTQQVDTFIFEGTVSGLCKLMAQRDSDLHVARGGTLHLKASDSVPCSVSLSQTSVHTKMLRAKSWRQGDDVSIYVLELQRFGQIVSRILHIDYSMAFPEVVCSDGFTYAASRLPSLSSSRCSTLLIDLYGVISAVGYYGELSILLHILCEVTEMKKRDIELRLHVQIGAKSYLHNSFFSQTSWLAYEFSTRMHGSSKLFPVSWASMFKTATLSGSVLQSALIVVGKYDTKAICTIVDPHFEHSDKDSRSPAFVVYSGNKHALMNALASAETSFETVIAQLDERGRFEACRVVPYSNFKLISVTELRQINSNQRNIYKSVLQRIVRQVVRDKSPIDEIATMHKAPTIWQLYPESYAILRRLQPKILCNTAHTFQLCHTESNNETALWVSAVCDPPVKSKLSYDTENNVSISCTIICARAFPISIVFLTQVEAHEDQVETTTWDFLNNLESSRICFHFDGTFEELVNIVSNKPTTSLKTMDRQSTVFVRRKGLSNLNEATNVCFNNVQILDSEKYSAQIKSLFFAFEVLRCNEQDFALRITFVGDNAQKGDAYYDMPKHDFSNCKYIEYTGNVLGIICFYEMLASVFHGTEQHELTILITDAHADDSSKCFQTGDYTVCCKKNENTSFLEFKSEIRKFLAIFTTQQTTYLGQRTRVNNIIYGDWGEYSRVYYSGCKENMCMFLSQLDKRYELLEVGIQRTESTVYGTVFGALASQTGSSVRFFDVVQTGSRHGLLRFVEEGSGHALTLPTSDGVNCFDDFVLYGSIETLHTVTYGCIFGSARIELTACFGMQFNTPIGLPTNNKPFKTEDVQCPYSQCQGYLHTFETDPITQILYVKNVNSQPTQTCAYNLPEFNVTHFLYSGDLYSLALFAFQFNILVSNCFFVLNHNKHATRFDTPRIIKKIITETALQRKYKVLTINLADDLSGNAELFGIVPLLEEGGGSSMLHINLEELSHLKPAQAQLFIYCGEMHDFAQLVIHGCLPTQVCVSDIRFSKSYEPRQHFTFGYGQRQPVDVLQPWAEKSKIFSTMSARCIKNYPDDAGDTKMIYVEKVGEDSRIEKEPHIMNQEPIKKPQAQCLILNAPTAWLPELVSVNIWSHFEKVFFERNKVALPLDVQTHTVLLPNQKCITLTEIVDSSPIFTQNSLVFLKSTDVTDLNPHETIYSTSEVNTMNLEWFQFSGNILGFCQRFQNISVIQAQTFAMRFILGNRASDIISKHSIDSYNTIILTRLHDTPMQCIVQISINNHAAIAMFAGYCQANESGLNADWRVDSQNTFEHNVFVGNYCTFATFVFTNPHIDHLWLDFRNCDCTHIDKNRCEIITFAGDYFLNRETLLPMAFDCIYLKQEEELACLFIRKNDDTSFVPAAEVVDSHPRLVDYTGTIDHFMQLLLHQMLPIPLSRIFIIHIEPSRTYVLNVSVTDSDLSLTWMLHLANDLSCFILAVVERKEGATCSLPLQEQVHNLAYVGKVETFEKLLSQNSVYLTKDCTIWWSATPFDTLNKWEIEYVTLKTGMKFLIYSCSNEDESAISWITIRQVSDTFMTQCCFQLQGDQRTEHFCYIGNIPAFVDLFALRNLKINVRGGATLTFIDSEPLTSELTNAGFNNLNFVSEKARIKEGLSLYNISRVVLKKNKSSCAKWIGCIGVNSIDCAVTQHRHALAKEFHSAVPAAFCFTGTKTAFVNFALNACPGDYETSAFCKYTSNDNEQWRLLPSVLQNGWIKYTVTAYNNFTALVIPHEQLSIIVEHIGGVTKTRNTDKSEQFYNAKYLFYVGSRAGLCDFYSGQTNSGSFSDHQLLCTFKDAWDTLHLKRMFNGLYSVKYNLSEHFAFVIINGISQKSLLFVIIYEVNILSDYTAALASALRFDVGRPLLEQMQSVTTVSHYKGSKYGLSALLSLLDAVHYDNLTVQIADAAGYCGSVSCVHLEQPCQHGTRHTHKFCAFDVVQQSIPVPASKVALRFVYDISARKPLTIKPQNSADWKIKHADEFVFYGPSKRLFTFAKWSSMKENLHTFNDGWALIYAFETATPECVKLKAPKITRKNVSLVIPNCKVKTIGGLQGYALLYVNTICVTSKGNQVDLQMQEQTAQQILFKGSLNLLAVFLSLHCINTVNMYLLSEERFPKHCSTAVDATDNLKTIKVFSKTNTQNCLIAGHIRSHDNASHPHLKAQLTIDRQPIESAAMFYHVGNPLTLLALYLTDALPNSVRNASMSVQDALRNPNFMTEAEHLPSLHYIQLLDQKLKIVTFNNKPAVEGVQSNYLTYICDAPEVPDISDRLAPLMMREKFDELSGFCLIMKPQLSMAAKLCTELSASHFAHIFICYEENNCLYANKVQFRAICVDAGNSNNVCNATIIPNGNRPAELHILLINANLKRDNVEVAEVFSLDKITIVDYFEFNGAIFDFCKMFFPITIVVQSGGVLHFGPEKHVAIAIAENISITVKHFAIKLSHLKIECYTAYSNGSVLAIAIHQCDDDRYNALDNKVLPNILAGQSITNTFNMAFTGSYRCFLQLLKECGDILLTAASIMVKIDGFYESDVHRIDDIFELRSWEPEWKDRFQPSSYHALMRDVDVYAIFIFSGIVSSLKVPRGTGLANPSFLHYSGNICEFMELLLDDYVPSKISHFTLEFNADIFNCSLSISDTSDKFCKVNKLLTADNAVLILSMTANDANVQIFPDDDCYRQLTSSIKYIAFTGHVHLVEELERHLGTSVLLHRNQPFDRFQLRTLPLIKINHGNLAILHDETS